MSEYQLNQHDQYIVPGDGIELRQLKVEDSQAYFDLIDFDRDHLSQHGDVTAAKYGTVSDVTESFEQSSGKLRFGIWVDDVMVGTNNLRISGAGKAELGSWIGKQYTGHAYAEKARNALIDFAFNRLNLQRVFSMVDANNLPSRKSVEHSGLLLQSIEGNTCVYALDRPDQSVGL